MQEKLETGQNSNLKNSRRPSFGDDIFNISSIQIGGIRKFCPPVPTFWSGCIRTFWTQKLRQEKLSKFIKTLNYIKFQIFLVLNCFKCFNKYILGQNVPKNQKKKVKIHKDFELYQVFMYNFLCQNVPILSYYVLLMRTKSIIQ